MRRYIFDGLSIQHQLQEKSSSIIQHCPSSGSKQDISASDFTLGYLLPGQYCALCPRNAAIPFQLMNSGYTYVKQQSILIAP